MRSILKANVVKQLKRITLFFFLFSNASVKAQQTKPFLHVNYPDSVNEIMAAFSFDANQKDSLSTLETLKSLLRDLQDEGYLTAEVKKMNWNKDTLKAALNIGQRFTWVNLSPGNLRSRFQQRLGFREKFFNKKPFRYQEVSKLMEKSLVYAEQNGFPFARIRLDSIEIKPTSVNAQISYTSGPLITFDSIRIHGNAKIKPTFLQAWLGIEPGKPYDERLITHLSNELKQLPFLKIEKDPEVSFRRGKAIVHVFVSRRKTDQLDGLVGILPKASEEGKMLINGEFQMKFNNLFASGKMLHLNWKKLKEGSQQLVVGYEHKALLYAPLSVSLNFELYKEDSTFINRDLRFALSWHKGLPGRLSIFSQVSTSSLLSIEPYLAMDDLSGFADNQLVSYGFGYKWNGLDDPLFPNQGSFIDLEGSFGRRKIVKNIGLPEQYYEDLDLESMQFEIHGVMGRYFSFWRRLVLLAQLQFGGQKNDQLLQNELIRLGGFQILRGFNENEFFASAFALSTVEVRFLIEKEAYLMFFYDQSYLENQLQGDNQYPLGLGAGLSFSTGSGVFSFIYAIGQSKFQPLAFDHSKVHFGFTSRF
ncbi:BamA/TamA family outer membrane protein [Xanthovirga aplysinae]|uniref:BamA/TamA family outer membrane protein n=1 Tax=Xanthovirga aplysinae TaxID=2529853 RepID=UPI0012BBE4F0|nr:BamA/TamA family outer membrane protein [Xanthovirga aplysinae]MTI33319.1 hypothetical protein [Xanthovirga aplysinae]